MNAPRLRFMVARVLAVVVTATCVVVVASRDAGALALCKPVAPSTVVKLRDAHGRVAATMTTESCGPDSTRVFVRPRAGGDIDGLRDFSILRRGTCRGQQPPVLYHGTGELAVPLGGARFARSAFAVEVFRRGEPAAAACGAHLGPVPLRAAAPESPRTIIRFRRSGKGYAAGPPLGSTSGPVAVRLMPARDGKTTLVTLGRSQTVPSGGGHAWLRPGSCRKHEHGSPIYLDDVQPEYPEGPPTSTRVDVPLEKLAARSLALEIDHGTGRPWGMVKVQWCYEL